VNKPSYRELEQRIRDLEQQVSERDKIQVRLQEAQKMQAVATLAGGIAHQFNNALASISLCIELICMDLPEDDPLLDHIQKMKTSTERMANLTSQLLAYAEGGRYQTRVISVHDFVREALPSVTHNLYPSVNVDTDLPPDTLRVKADVTQMQMVLSAVIHNAAEAMDGGGWIRVRTRNQVVSESSSEHLLDLAPGVYVCLSVEDNGKGMDEETRKRIFEPFFTTKFHGRGLGMPAVYGIVKGHKGCVLVDSAPGKGTCVRIYLPAVELGERPLEVREAAPMKGAGTVLLVEDEELIVEVGKELLERIGYRVLTAETGKEALETASAFQGKIDLVILDVILPDMGGRDIYENLVKVRPGLKVLVCSGFSLEGPAQEILDSGAEGFIQKPFSLSDLNRHLNEILKKA
jgi:two-component system, cell cycle sensor histidine kinase and response regulator CckA